MKTIKFRSTTQPSDLSRLAQQATKFLGKGEHVRVICRGQWRTQDGQRRPFNTPMTIATLGNFLDEVAYKKFTPFRWAGIDLVTDVT